MRKIFANHCHTYPASVRENGTVEALKVYLDALGIEKAVTFAPFPHVLEKAAIDKNNNDYLYVQIKGDDRFIGFGTIDFTRDDIASQVSHISDLGFKGIKIHPAAQEIKVTGKKAFEAYQTAEELGLFLSFHTGIHRHRLSDYQPILFDEVAYNFPNLKFSMEHMGGYHFFREALAVMCNNDNVYAGWTSIDSAEMPGAWSVSDIELLTVVKQIGGDKIVFGTDFPFKNVDYVAKSIERFENLDISDEAKDGLFGKNLANALNIDF